MCVCVCGSTLFVDLHVLLEKFLSFQNGKERASRKRERSSVYCERATALIYVFGLLWLGLVSALDLLLLTALRQRRCGPGFIPP